MRFRSKRALIASPLPLYTLDFSLLCQTLFAVLLSPVAREADERSSKPQRQREM